MRIDRTGEHRVAFDKNKKKILATQEICGICGRPVDKTLRYPHPLAPSIDHIIPVSRGGHPSDIANLQLAHWICNRQKSDKMTRPLPVEEERSDEVNNRNLPLHFDWRRYGNQYGRV